MTPNEGKQDKRLQDIFNERWQKFIANTPLPDTQPGEAVNLDDIQDTEEVVSVYQEDQR